MQTHASFYSRAKMHQFSKTGQHVSKQRELTDALKKEICARYKPTLHRLVLKKQ